MWICLECGHHFEQGEESVWVEAHGERMSGCPVCRSAYAESERCSKCFGDHLGEDLHAGICLECIAESVTLDNVFEYIKLPDVKEDFYSYFFDSDIRDCSLDMDIALESYIRKQVMLDKLLCRETTVEKLVAYVCQDDESVTCWAEWLAEREARVR